MDYANNFEELGHFVWNIWGVLLGSIVSHFQTRVYSNSNIEQNKTTIYHGTNKQPRKRTKSK